MKGGSEAEMLLKGRIERRITYSVKSSNSELLLQARAVIGFYKYIVIFIIILPFKYTIDLIQGEIYRYKFHTKRVK